MGFGGLRPPKPISFPHPLAELVIPQRSKESTGCGQRGWFSHYNTSPSHPPWRSLSFRSEARNLLHVGRGGGSRITIPLLSSPSLAEFVIPQRSKESTGCGQRGWFSHYNTSPFLSLPGGACHSAAKQGICWMWAEGVVLALQYLSFATPLAEHTIPQL